MRKIVICVGKTKLKSDIHNKKRFMKRAKNLGIRNIAPLNALRFVKKRFENCDECVLIVYICEMPAVKKKAL